MNTYHCPTWCRSDHACGLEVDAECGFTLHQAERVEVTLSPVDGVTRARPVSVLVEQVEELDGTLEQATVTLFRVDVEPIGPEDARKLAAALLAAAERAEYAALAVTR